MVNGSSGSRYRYLSGLGKDGKLARQNRIRRVDTCQQMTLRDTHHIAGLVQCDIDMGRAGIVLDPAVSIITEDRHSIRGFLHVGIASIALIEVSLEVFVKLIILQQERHQGHHDCGAVLIALVKFVVLNGFGILIIDAGHDITASTVKHDQMICIRTCRGFVLRYRAVVNGTYCTFACACHTVTDCVDGLDHGAA